MIVLIISRNSRVTIPSDKSSYSEFVWRFTSITFIHGIFCRQSVMLALLNYRYMRLIILMSQNAMNLDESNLNGIAVVKGKCYSLPLGKTC